MITVTNNLFIKNSPNISETKKEPEKKSALNIKIQSSWTSFLELMCCGCQDKVQDFCPSPDCVKSQESSQTIQNSNHSPENNVDFLAIFDMPNSTIATVQEFEKQTESVEEEKNNRCSSPQPSPVDFTDECSLSQSNASRSSSPSMTILEFLKEENQKHLALVSS